MGGAGGRGMDANWLEGCEYCTGVVDVFANGFIVLELVGIPRIVGS